MKEFEVIALGLLVLFVLGKKSTPAAPAQDPLAQVFNGAANLLNAFRGPPATFNDTATPLTGGSDKVPGHFYNASSPADDYLFTPPAPEPGGETYA